MLAFPFGFSNQGFKYERAQGGNECAANRPPMSAHFFCRSTLGIAAAIALLTGCGGGGTSTTSTPSLPVAAQFNLDVVNSVVHGSKQSSISFNVQDSTKNCIEFFEPFSDQHLNYGDSAERAIGLLDCGADGWFTVQFHALDVSLADTTVKWTVSEGGVSESIVEQGGLCVKQTSALKITEEITAKPPSGCPAN